MFSTPLQPALYLNENVSVKVAELLSSHGIKTIHTLDVKNIGKDDEFQLSYATSNGCIMLTHNRKDFRNIHKKWIALGKSHGGILLIGCFEPGIIVQRVINFLNQILPKCNPSFCEVPPES